MANTPFKLKSGNVTPFKQMGASPAKSVLDVIKAAKMAGENEATTVTDTGKNPVDVIAAALEKEKIANETGLVEEDTEV